MAQKTKITWLGHATVLVETTQGTNLLIDPYITGNPKFPQGFQLPEKLPYILLTHGHADHCGDAVPVAQKHGSTIVAIYELAGHMSRHGVQHTIGMNLGGSVQLNDVTATMVEAKHSTYFQDEQGMHYAGVAAGFVLTIQDGPVIYHAGDTAVFGDMGLIHELYHPEIVILPIGGHFTMGPKEAAMASQLLKPKTILPIHFGTFPPLTGIPGELSSLVEEDIKVISWAPGDTYQEF